MLKTKRYGWICFMAQMMIFALVGCAAENQLDKNLNTADQDAVDVSIIALIANPDEYDGKVVRVMGVGRLEFEGNSIYLHKEDYEMRNSRNGLWISLGSEATPYEDAEKYNGEYVLIEGVFSKENHGHMGLWSGAIVNITRYIRWR